jgi:hypothetical protein
MMEGEYTPDAVNTAPNIVPELRVARDEMDMLHAVYEIF